MDSIISTVQAINLLTGEDETFTVEHTQEKVWTIRYANGLLLSTSSDQFTEVEAALLIGGRSGGVGGHRGRGGAAAAITTFVRDRARVAGHVHARARSERIGNGGPDHRRS